MCPSSRIYGQLPAPIVNGRRDSFWKWPDFQLWRALDLDLGSGHTAYRYRRASLIDLYLQAKFHWNWRNCLWTDRRTYVRTDGRTFETGFIRSTLSKSWPKNSMYKSYDILCRYTMIGIQIKKINLTLKWTCIVELSSVCKVHCTTAGKIWFTSTSLRGTELQRTSTVKISIDTCIVQWHKFNNNSNIKNIIVQVLRYTRRSSQTISWLNTKKLNQNTTKANTHPQQNIPQHKMNLKISPVQKPTVDSLQLTFVPTSKSRDTKTRPNIKNLAWTNLDIVP